MSNALVKVFCVLCCCMIAGSVLLPYLTLSPEEMIILNATTDEYRLMQDAAPSSIVLVIAAAGLIFALVGWYLLSAVAGLAAVGATFYIQAAIARRIPDFMAHYGVAYYLLLIGGIALFILSVVGCVVKAMSKRAK